VDRELLLGVYVVLLAAIVGAQVVRRVPVPLHLPLLAGTGAVRALILVGALLVLGQADSWWLQLVGFLATVAAAANLVGGLVAADRSLAELGGTSGPARTARALAPGGRRPTERSGRRGWRR
jgi:NAD(P) transhydrogenase subunit alpha